MKSINELKKFIELTKEPFFCDHDTITPEIFELLKTIKDVNLLNGLFSKEKKYENSSSKYPVFNVEFVCPNCGKKTMETLIAKSAIINRMILEEGQSVEYENCSYGTKTGEYWCKECIEKLAISEHQRACDEEKERQRIRRQNEMLAKAKVEQEKNFDRLILQKWFSLTEQNGYEYTYQELVNDFQNLESKQYYKELFSEEYKKVPDFKQTIYYIICESEAAEIKKHKCEICGSKQDLTFVFCGKIESAYKTLSSFHCINKNILSEYGENYVKHYFEEPEDINDNPDIHGIREICRFGKYKGNDFGTILKFNPGYLVWYKQNVKPEFNIVDQKGNTLL